MPPSSNRPAAARQKAVTIPRVQEKGEKGLVLPSDPFVFGRDSTKLKTVQEKSDRFIGTAPLVPPVFTICEKIPNRGKKWQAPSKRQVSETLRVANPGERQQVQGLRTEPSPEQSSTVLKPNRLDKSSSLSAGERRLSAMAEKLYVIQHLQHRLFPSLRIRGVRIFSYIWTSVRWVCNLVRYSFILSSGSSGLASAVTHLGLSATLVLGPISSVLSLVLAVVSYRLIKRKAREHHRAFLEIDLSLDRFKDKIEKNHRLKQYRKFLIKKAAAGRDFYRQLRRLSNLFLAGSIVSSVIVGVQVGLAIALFTGVIVSSPVGWVIGGIGAMVGVVYFLFSCYYFVLNRRNYDQFALNCRDHVKSGEDGELPVAKHPDLNAGALLAINLFDPEVGFLCRANAFDALEEQKNALTELMDMAADAIEQKPKGSLFVRMVDALACCRALGAASVILVKMVSLQKARDRYRHTFSAHRGYLNTKKLERWFDTEPGGKALSYFISEYIRVGCESQSLKIYWGSKILRQMEKSPENNGRAIVLLRKAMEDERVLDRKMRDCSNGEAEARRFFREALGGEDLLSNDGGANGNKKSRNESKIMAEILVEKLSVRLRDARVILVETEILSAAVTNVK